MLAFLRNFWKDSCRKTYHPGHGDNGKPLEWGILMNSTTKLKAVRPKLLSAAV